MYIFGKNTIRHRWDWDLNIGEFPGFGGLIGLLSTTLRGTFMIKTRWWQLRYLDLFSSRSLRKKNPILTFAYFSNGLVQPTRKTRCFQRCSIFFILNLGAPWLDFHIFFFRWGWWTNHQVVIDWIYPPPRMPVANEGLGWDSLLKMVHNPGGDCYWVGGRPKLYNSLACFGILLGYFD